MYSSILCFLLGHTELRISVCVRLGALVVTSIIGGSCERGSGEHIVVNVRPFSKHSEPKPRLGNMLTNCRPWMSNYLTRSGMTHSVRTPFGCFALYKLQMCTFQIMFCLFVCCTSLHLNTVLSIVFYLILAIFVWTSLHRLQYSVVSLSSDICRTICKPLRIKASAKYPKCKC